MKTRDITILSLLLAISFVLSYLEFCLPVFIPIPGVKLGLANVATMYVLYKYSPWKAFSFVFIRVLLTSMIFSGFNTFLFSLAGGMLSILLMFPAMKMKFFSMLGVSMIGAIAHNIGQIIVACILMKNANIFYYLPVLLVSGIVAGFFVGYVSYLLVEKMRDR
ncbi:MAG: Gx transporter family protein [Lachnospiraceae bacterium]